MLYGQVYIGDLGNDGTRYELEEAFSEYGSVKNIWVAKKPPGKHTITLIRVTYTDFGMGGTYHK